MGVGVASIAVCDAGPLIHLTEIGCISLLRVFDALHISAAVWLETVRPGRVPQEAIDGLSIAQRHSLPQAEVRQFVRTNHLEALDDGECECLYLCQRTGTSILLTDDLAVRETAKQLGLTPVGSLGVVVRAYRQGLAALTEAERHIADLYSVSSLFVTRAIVEMAVEELHRRAPPAKNG